MERLPSESMWSGSPFRVVAGAMMGNATESAEHNANLSFFFASLEDKDPKKMKPISENLPEVLSQ